MYILLTGCVYIYGIQQDILIFVYNVAWLSQGSPKPHSLAESPLY